jgi:polysaccharide pyruvyl transferase WcaK-like protein
MKVRETSARKIALFGHFDATNLGNESTIQAVLHHLRRYQPEAEIACISTGPKEAIAASHQIEVIPISQQFVKSWRPRNRILRLLRSVVIGIPSELYRWIVGFVKLGRVDALIIPGTGLLTDAYGLGDWGPYNLFKWSLLAKIRNCKLFFVSVGAGPIRSVAGKWLVRSTLSLADFRSYRDNSSVQCLNSIGFRTHNDRVYPDLAFSLPIAAQLHSHGETRRRTVVGLGVMTYSGRTSGVYGTHGNYLLYLERLADLTHWLLARGSDVRLLIGDFVDVAATEEFKCLLRKRPLVSSEAHIIDEPIGSLNDLLSQIAATDIVVATRFHNVLLGLLCEKPVISISFHPKCSSLMSAMGLSNYSLEIHDLETDKLIEMLCDLELNADSVRASIREKNGEFREALDEQYRFCFQENFAKHLKES